MIFLKKINKDSILYKDVTQLNIYVMLLIGCGCLMFLMVASYAVFSVIIDGKNTINLVYDPNK